MVSDNQHDQYFQFVKDMILEEDISEPFIHSAYTSIKISIQGVRQSNAAMYMI